MYTNHSVQFFDTQFQQQVGQRDFHLNPFELTVLPLLRGRVLDFGCGMGNLACAAAQQGCTVLALDASPAAITHIRQRAGEEKLPVQAVLADLHDYPIDGEFDAVVSIGLLMFLDCPSAFRALENLKEHVREGGLAAVNVMVEGTTYLEMFEAESHCLFSPTELQSRFAGWTVLFSECSSFEAPGGRRKDFATMIARKPPHPGRLPKPGT